MASTNKTTNYELSQYIGTDKPTYLTDYNQDMSKIDAGIHAAKSEADTNSTSIGTLSSLTTDVKTSLVAALNEVDGHADTNAGNIATNTSNIATNTTHIGTLANLTTASKTDLVVASNEINAKVGDIGALTTTAKSSTVAAINEINSEIPDVFDDVEHLTNKIWIDDKPVYRIVLTGNVDSGGQWNSINVSDLNIDHLVDLHMKLVTSADEQYFNNFYVSAQFQAGVRYVSFNNGTVQYFVGTGYSSGATYRITVEYTKSN